VTAVATVKEIFNLGMRQPVPTWNREPRMKRQSDEWQRIVILREHCRRGHCWTHPIGMQMLVKLFVLRGW